MIHIDLNTQEFRALYSVTRATCHFVASMDVGIRP